MVESNSLIGAVSRYAAAFHKEAGDQHHVASPFGAWLIIALCASLACGPERDQLVDAVGAEPAAARQFAASLLEQPHPLVGSGVAVWNRPQVDTAELKTWRSGLPPSVEKGDIPPQSLLDSWASDRTSGLIREFPLDIDPGDLFLMASALATKVSWEKPFELVSAELLGASSPWATRLSRVLGSPVGDPRHQQFIVRTKQAGIVVVHNTRARDGLVVTSVAAASEVPALAVIEAAYEIACTEAIRPRGIDRTSLFDLPLGEGDLWTIHEEEAEIRAGGHGAERCEAVLPAWSARSKFDLSKAQLGFASAARALATAMRLKDYQYRASQAAMARYTRVGFEAAAVSGLAMKMSAVRRAPGVRRIAQLRFARPFAVVGVTVDDTHEAFQRTGKHGPWHGLPVFSAWITDPSDAT